MARLLQISSAPQQRIDRQSKELPTSLRSIHPLPHTTAIANNADGRKPQTNQTSPSLLPPNNHIPKMPPNPTGNAASDPEAKKKAARETIDILHEISTLLVSRLSDRLLLFENGLLTIHWKEHGPRPPIPQLLRLTDREWS